MDPLACALFLFPSLLSFSFPPSSFISSPPFPSSPLRFFSSLCFFSWSRLFWGWKPESQAGGNFSPRTAVTVLIQYLILRAAVRFHVYVVAVPSDSWWGLSLIMPTQPPQLDTDKKAPQTDLQQASSCTVPWDMPRDLFRDACLGVALLGPGSQGHLS